MGYFSSVINRQIEKKNEKSENNPSQKTPESPNDNPNPESILPTDTENWWLTDEEIEYAYQEIRKEITNSPEIQLVSPAITHYIQEGGEISEDLKKAKIIFFPINNSESHETGDSGSHWTLLALETPTFTKGGKREAFINYNSAGSTIPTNAQKLVEKKKFTRKWG